MKALRWLAAGLVWILAGLLGLVGGLVSLTIILLPVGIPLLLLARRLFRTAGQLALPRSVRHPVQESGKSARRAGKEARKALEGGVRKSRKSGNRLLGRLRG